MQWRAFLLSVAVAQALAGVAQLMPFGGGALHVDTGTTMRFAGPLVWQLAPDATVVNDGSIDLGTEAQLAEVDGSPISGMGYEVAIWAPAAPLNGAQAGGLGLTITSTYADGGLTVERGHLPASAANGTPSIARWYRISTPTPTTADMLVDFRYDPVELNGILPASLSLFKAPDLSGTWTALLTLADEPNHSLAATDPSPSAYLTAFDFDAVNGFDADDDAHTARVWPTVVHDQLNIAMPLGQPIRRIAILDSRGTRVLSTSLHAPSCIARIDLSALADGLYMVQVNDARSAQRVIKQ
ncbi:MAG: T9SS type A sorting domain-containing protein [Flavobacteriales bacterium]|nr:T9SS type A sorting domain-containing protein [Flavobacteriales bacterium]